MARAMDHRAPTNEMLVRVAAGRVSRATASFEERMGARLRHVRHRCGFTLEQVHHRSGGEFKPAALSAYERGQRRMSIERLQRLATIYGVRLHDIVPAGSHGLGDETHEWARRALAARVANDQFRAVHEVREVQRLRAGEHPGLVIDVTALEERNTPALEPVRRYVQMVQRERDEQGHPLMAIRRGDVRLVGHLLGVAPDEARQQLGVLGLSPRD